LNNKRTLYTEKLRSQLSKFTSLSQDSWIALESILRIEKVAKGTILLKAGKVPKYIYFIVKGIVVICYISQDGKVYNKNILFENEFPAATAALIKNKPTKLTIKTIEDTTLIACDFVALKKLMRSRDDLKDLYISYLEQNWVLKKNDIELSIATEGAKERYLKLIELHPDIESRVPLHHIASHLGITPTQMSRIRKGRFN